MKTDPSTSRSIDYVLKRLDEESLLHEATVILVGSAARGARSWRSDVDVVVVTPDTLARWRTPMELHLHLESRERFLERIRDGDDFALWAVKFGKVVSDPKTWWPTAQQEARAAPWPSAVKKIELAERRLAMALDLLEMADLPSAEEQLLTSASHLARAKLLDHGIFPHSRGELPVQLRELGEKRLADLIDRLIKGGLKFARLVEIANELQSQLQPVKVPR